MFRAHRYSVAALLAVGLCITGPACASQTYGYRGGGYTRDIQRRAYDNGYREGLDHGGRDARRGQRFSSIERHRKYRDAEEGYRRADGDRNLYRQSFRQGFQAGYRETFAHVAGPYARGYPPTSRYPDQNPYPNGYPYPSGYPAGPRGAYGSPAAQVGYRDGLEAGRHDARNRESYDPVRSRSYRAADHDYDRRFGSKDNYKSEYRVAFKQGYNEAFRGGGGR